MAAPERRDFFWSNLAGPRFFRTASLREDLWARVLRSNLAGPPQGRSTTTAIPWPPPMHSAARPVLSPRSWSA